MNRLLHASFDRLLKNKLFLTGIGFMFAASCAFILKQYQQLKVYKIPVSLESVFFNYALFIGVVSAIFCSLFLGVEYSDGTMRNKIIVGHKRTDIYFSSLITNITASLLLCVSYILPNIFLGIPLLGFKNSDFSKILKLMAGSILLVIALCAIFTMVSLLVQNKAVAPVICIVGIFLMTGFEMEVARMLKQPKFYYGTERNPNYLEGAARKKFEFYYNFLPAGQQMQYAGMQTKNIDEMCLYSAAITIVTTGIGVFFFRRKDIK